MEFKALSYLEDAVISKSPKEIRRAILSYIKKCLGDTDEIKSALNYVENNLNDTEYSAIWETYDGIHMESDRSKWDKSYFASVEVDLSDNFSIERFNHILDVGRYVYGTSNRSSVAKPEAINKTISKESDKNLLPGILILGGGIIAGLVIISKLMKK